jgi:hypothetical protein
MIANIAEIRDHFRLETAGDAWALVMDRNWPVERPEPGDEQSGPWQIDVPEEEW